MGNDPYDASLGAPSSIDVDGKPQVSADLIPVPSSSRVGARPVVGRALLAMPWVLVLGVAVVALLQAGTPAWDIARYGAYWALAVTLPGVLVARATVGSRGNWPEDIALGAVTGLALELVCFAMWSILGLQQQLWVWPLLVAVIFVAAPPLRRHWRISSPRPLPQLWSWGVAGAIGVATILVRQSVFSAPLPPGGGNYYRDLSWHLSIVHELIRSFPPQVPQAVGEVLRYHWFSDAHLAAAHLVSGTPEAMVLLRLWIIPLLAVTALIGARLAMELSGRWWSGPVAAWALVVLQGTDLLPVSGDAALVFPDSPSQVLVLPLVLGATLLIVRALRGLRLGAGCSGWVVLALLLIAAAGTKPTAMPLVLAGACLAGLSLLVQRRRQWLAALSVVAMVAVILPVSFRAVAGSDGASRIGLFDFVEWIPLYYSLTGAGFAAADGPILPEGLNDLSARSVLILALLLLVPLVANLGHLAPFATIASKRLRRDPAVWFMAGVLIAGWGVYLVLAHPYQSQAYFLRLANALAAVFGAWALAAVVPRAVRGDRRRLAASAPIAAILVGGTLVGAAVVALGRAVSSAMSPDLQSRSETVAPFVAPLVVVCAASVAGLVAWRVARRRIPGLRGWGLGLALSALVLGGPAYGATQSFDPALEAFVDNRTLPPRFGPLLHPDAGVAMAWVNQNTPNDAVVATNRHCDDGPERVRCPATAFWVTGLGGRRTVLEGWGYVAGVPRNFHPSPFPERLAVNDAVFTDPSETTIERLRQGYGASWLVADRSAGPVSSELARFAIPRFSSGEITVYQLP